VLGVAAFVLMLGTTGLATATRYLLAHGFEWSYEAAAFAFLWVTFLGGLLAELRHENVAFDAIDARRRPAGRRRLAILRTVLLLVLGAALAVSGAMALQRAGHTPSPVLRWPMGVVVVVVPMLGVGLCLIALARLRGFFRAPRE
jgi:TRAP-type C4-dicarboxylate transport system permease small subunit